MTTPITTFRRCAAPLRAFRCDDSRGRSVGLLGVLLLALGCSSEPDIKQYTVDTREPEQLQTEQRMLGAIVPQGDAVWFFKVVGPAEEVEPVADEIRRWVAEVRFDGGEPVLDLPDQWQRRPGGPMRFATVEIPSGDPPLEMSISQLSRSAEWEPLVAMNVNRWRQQMGLDASDAPFAEAEPLTENAEGDDQPTAMWVDLTGTFGGGPSMTPPFAAGAGAGGAAPFAGGAGSQAASIQGPGGPGAGAAGAQSGRSGQTESGRPTYDVPEGWREGPTNSMRLAAFKVGPEEREAELTVIPAGGGERDNVSRWLGQIRPGEAVDEALLDQVIEDAQAVTVDGRPGKRFLLPGSGAPPMATDATIVPLGDGFSMFIKLTGDARTVAEQSDNVTQFLNSLKLNR